MSWKGLSSGEACSDDAGWSGEPHPDIFVPRAVRDAAGPEPIRPVWRNEAAGVTFQVGVGIDRRFVKWSPPGGIDLTGEAARLRWAAAHVTVPLILGMGSDDQGSTLITAGLPGENAVTARWKADPAKAVAAIGAGLRELHEAAPASTCPFDWTQPARLGEILSGAGRLDPGDWHPEHQDLTVELALARLEHPPDVDRAVVCHGDACAPNTLLADDGTVSGRVDLGALGVADRWADLAIATWSTNWNYGPGWERPLLEAYGIEPDPERTAYYRLLWDLGPRRLRT
ncbi:kanamycin kinase [Nakamurella sp. UYEF19]|uniref:aminoglycoside 3'-phosphotransferase n=1 Tax=Nakamurella sp. UYEF19 TaxID=1756392 RepID=UPI003393FC0A